MADVTKLVSFVNAYGVGVRAGSITPCVEDEVYIRKMFDLPEMPKSVASDWASTGGIRRPITLVQDAAAQQTQPQTGQPDKV